MANFITSANQCQGWLLRGKTTNNCAGVAYSDDNILEVGCCIDGYQLGRCEICLGNFKVHRVKKIEHYVFLILILPSSLSCGHPHLF